MSRSQRFVFTLNNYTDEVEQLLSVFSERDDCAYLTYGREVGESGTPHLQGYVVMKRRFTFTVFNSFPPFNQAHVEAAKGSNTQAITYCHKDGDIVEFGERPNIQGNTSGKRNDCGECIEWLESFIEEEKRAPTEREVARLMPQALLKYSNFMRLVALRAPDPMLQDGELRDWQIDLAAALDLDCLDDRQVLFYVDENGGKGKSFFCRWYLSKNPDRVQLMHPAGYADMAYALDPSKSVYLFNVSRTGMEFLQYRFLEDLKDRLVFSTKYQSSMKVLDKVPHVVIFCNEQPNTIRMSEDRYNINNL